MNRFYKGNKCKRCSKLITIKNKSGYCRSCKMLGNTITLGRKRPISERVFMSKSRLEEKNPNWKGNNVGLSALHEWVKKRLIKNKFCQKCNLEASYDLTNKGIYNRDFNNWEWLCRKCHMLKDGRLEKLIYANKNRSSR